MESRSESSSGEALESDIDQQSLLTHLREHWPELRTISNPGLVPFKPELVTLKTNSHFMIVNDSAAVQAFVSCAPRAIPDTVERDAALAKQIKHRLPAKLGAPIADTLYVGEFDSR